MKQNKLSNFSGIKAVAVLLIFWEHTNFANPPESIAPVMCTLLFIVSGFLTAYNRSDSYPNPTWKDSVSYYLKKFTQVWPLHFITFLVTFLFIRYNTGLHTYVTAIINLLLLQSWSYNGNVFLSFNGLSWFLSSLMFCYFMAPFFIKLTNTKKKTALWLTFSLVASLGVFYMIRRCGPYYFHIERSVSPIIHSFEFLEGICICRLYKYLSDDTKIFDNKILMNIAEFLSTVVIVYLVFTRGAMFRPILIFAFCIYIFIISFNKGIISRLYSIKPLTWLSSIQMEFYLIHGITIPIMGEILFNFIPYDTKFMGYVALTSFVLTIILSVLYHKFLNKQLVSLLRGAISKLLKSLGYNLI